MTRCSKAHAVDFIQNAGGIPIVFGYLMRTDLTTKRQRKPASGGVFIKRQTAEDILQDQEHCLSIIWSLIVALDSEPTENVQEKLSLERVCFKLIEGRFDKLTRLIEIFRRQFTKVAEFDLEEFRTPEEIGYLEADFGLDLLALCACLIAYAAGSATCKRLLQH